MQTMFVKLCILRLGICQAYQSHNSNHLIEYLQCKYTNGHIVLIHVTSLTWRKFLQNIISRRDGPCKQYRNKPEMKTHKKTTPHLYMQQMQDGLVFLFHHHFRVGRLLACLSLLCFCTYYRSIPTGKEVLQKLLRSLVFTVLVDVLSLWTC